MKQAYEIPLLKSGILVKVLVVSPMNQVCIVKRIKMIKRRSGRLKDDDGAKAGIVGRGVVTSDDSTVSRAVIMYEPRSIIALNIFFAPLC